MPEDHTPSRKTDHVKICLAKDVAFKKSNGFDQYEFEHNAVPEIDFDDIDTSLTFLGKKFSAPLIISSMTGGTEETGRINKNLAAGAQSVGIGMGVGSQRAALKDPKREETYQVRDVAPDILLFGNIGAAQLTEYDNDSLERLVTMIKGDALAIHFNAAQELVQPEGDLKWRGILDRLKTITSDISFPVIAKEVGNGIGGQAAKKLASTGIQVLDVAGAGGTSWVKVEHHRGAKNAEPLFEWGLPTAQCVSECASTLSIPVIASGGVRTGMDMAKALSLGATLCGVAQPFLKPGVVSAEAVEKKAQELIHELKQIMFLVGARTLNDLRKVPLKRV